MFSIYVIWLILPKIPTGAGAPCCSQVNGEGSSGHSEHKTGEPGRFPVSLISIRRSVTPAISVIIDHVPARAPLYSPHLLERRREVLLYTFIGGKKITP